MLKRISAVLLCIQLMLVVVCFPMYAQETPEGILRQHGVPQEVIELMTEGQKQYISSRMPHDSEFVSYDVQNGSFLEDDVSTYGIIPSADMTLSVMCMRSTSDVYYMYPSFVWNSASYNASNDLFGIALYPGWEMLPDTVPNCRLWATNVNGAQVAYDDYSAEWLNAYGAVFHFGDGLLSSGPFEGYASFCATKNTSTATNAVSVTYAHDTTTLFNLSYGVSVGYASISITANRPSYMDTMSKNLSFSVN